MKKLLLDIPFHWLTSNSHVQALVQGKAGRAHNRASALVYQPTSPVLPASSTVSVLRHDTCPSTSTGRVRGAGRGRGKGRLGRGLARRMNVGSAPGRIGRGRGRSKGMGKGQGKGLGGRSRSTDNPNETVRNLSSAFNTASSSSVQAVRESCDPVTGRAPDAADVLERESIAVDV